MDKKTTKPVDGVDLAAVTKEITDKRAAERLERATAKIKAKVGVLLSVKDHQVRNVERIQKELNEAQAALDKTLANIAKVQAGDWSGLDKDEDDHLHLTRPAFEGLIFHDHPILRFRHGFPY